MLLFKRSNYYIAAFQIYENFVVHRSGFTFLNGFQIKKIRSLKIAKIDKISAKLCN